MKMAASTKEDKLLNLSQLHLTQYYYYVLLLVMVIRTQVDHFCLKMTQKKK